MKDLIKIIKKFVKTKKGKAYIKIAAVAVMRLTPDYIDEIIQGLLLASGIQEIKSSNKDKNLDNF